MKNIRLSLCSITSLEPLHGMHEPRTLVAYENMLVSGNCENEKNDLQLGNNALSP